MIIDKIFCLLNRWYLRWRLGAVGDSFRIGTHSTILKPKYVHVGNEFFTGQGLYISTNKYNPIKIGESVMFGPFVTILGGNHDYRYTGGHMMYCKSEAHCNSEITIEDGCWIGANTTILSGAKIGEGAVIGAMSLVNSYIPPYTIAVGIPAKPIKKRFDDINDLKLLLGNVNSKYSKEAILSNYEEYF